jgi:hypothetical protein
VSDAGHDEEPPAEVAPATPEEPQTSVHTQTVGPEVAKSDAPDEPAERTIEEEELRRRAGGDDR